MVLLIYQDLEPLKVSISKLIFKKSNISKFNKNQMDKGTKNSAQFPPKKAKNRNKIIINSDLKENTEKINFKEANKKGISGKTKTNSKKKNAKKSGQNRKKNLRESNKIIFNISNYNSGNTLKKEGKNSFVDKQTLTSKKLVVNNNKQGLISEIEGKSLENLSHKFEDYDNFELNNLEYLPACDLDKRSFCQTYWSVLLREHIGIMTFLACKDHNIFYIKLIRFIIQFCTNFAMNGLFFSDESMHYLYVNNGEYSFVQKIPQLVFSLIAGHILEVILCYLSLTDAPFYEIKELSRNLTKESQEKILQIIKCLQKKIITFYLFTFILFLFYWYFISAFCAVYHNTQQVFIKDSFISFLTSMLDPFLTYAITTMLRAISLSSCCKKKFSFVYGMSDIIPFF